MTGFLWNAVENSLRGRIESGYNALSKKGSGQEVILRAKQNVLFVWQEGFEEELLPKRGVRATQQVSFARRQGSIHPHQ